MASADQENPPAGGGTPPPSSTDAPAEAPLVETPPEHAGSVEASGAPPPEIDHAHETTPAPRMSPTPEVESPADPLPSPARIPATSSPPAPSAPSVAPSAQSETPPDLDDDPADAAAGPTIFVSDPTVEAARVEWALRARGYTVFEVPLAMLVGRVAVQKPDVVLLDADAPGASEAAARVRQIAGGPEEVRLVYLGDAAAVGVDDARGDASGFFSRPVDIDALVALVDGLIATRESAAEAPSSARRPHVARKSSHPPPPPSLGAPFAHFPPIRSASIAPFGAAAVGATFPGGSGRSAAPGTSVRATEPPPPMRRTPAAPENEPPKAWGVRGGEARLSPDLERVLREAETRVHAVALTRARVDSLPSSGGDLLTPEEEVDAVLPAEILASLDEPLDVDFEDGGTGPGTSHGTAGTPGVGDPSRARDVTASGGTRDGNRSELGKHSERRTPPSPPFPASPASPTSPARQRSHPSMERASASRAEEIAASLARGMTPLSVPPAPALPHPNSLASPAATTAPPPRAAHRARPSRQATDRSTGEAPTGDAFHPVIASSRILTSDDSPPPLTPRTVRPPRGPKPSSSTRGADRESTGTSSGAETGTSEGTVAPVEGRAAGRDSGLATYSRAAATTPPDHDPEASSSAGSARRALPSPVAPPLPPPRLVSSADASLRAFANAVASRITGVLRMDEPAGIRRLVLQDGDVVTAASSVDGESLLAFLVGRGDLGADVARKLEGRVPPFGRLAGAALVAHGHVHQEQLWDTLQQHAAWLLTRAVAVTRGEVSFEAEPPARLRGEPPVFGGTPGPTLVVEITRRAVPPEEAIARLGGTDVRVTGGARGKLLDECGLEEADDVLGWRSTSPTLRELIEARGEDIAPLVYALVSLGILELLSPPRAKLLQDGDDDPPVDPSRDAELDDGAIRGRIIARRSLVEDGDYFAILGVPPAATGYEIRRAYVALRRSFEPAIVVRPSLADLARDLELIVEVVDEAYEILKDPTRRERYRRAIGGGPKRQSEP